MEKKSREMEKNRETVASVAGDLHAFLAADSERRPNCSERAFLLFPLWAAHFERGLLQISDCCRSQTAADHRLLQTESAKFTL